MFPVLRAQVCHSPLVGSSRPGDSALGPEKTDLGSLSVVLRDHSRSQIFLTDLQQKKKNRKILLFISLNLFCLRPQLHPEIISSHFVVLTSHFKNEMIVTIGFIFNVLIWQNRNLAILC